MDRNYKKLISESLKGQKIARIVARGIEACEGHCDH